MAKQQHSTVAREAEEADHIARVKEGLDTYFLALEDNKALRQELEAAKRDRDVLKSKVDYQQSIIDDLQTKLAWYMRHTTELQTHFNDVADILDKASAKARHGMYAPPERHAMIDMPKAPMLSNGGSPPDDGAPVPRFLTDPQPTA